MEEIYGFQVSPELISTVTDEVMEEVKAWQHRPLDAVYPIVYLDVMIVKVKDQGHIRNKALYIAIGVNLQGQREVLGLWIAQTEGAKFWLTVLTELKNRGLQDIFIACVDGLTGFPEAIAATYSQTQVQLCIVHLMRNSLNYVSRKDRRRVAADLKPIYQAINAAEAEEALQSFKAKWDDQYPTIGLTWQRHWQHVIPFLAYPEETRRAIYTTNIIEAANRQVRKVIKTKGAFSNDEAVYKIVYLALKNAQKLWSMATREWNLALNQFAILFEERFPAMEL